MNDRHVTTPTREVQIDGTTFAYRRWGRPGTVPVLLIPHFRAGMDHWDPLVTDSLALEREVILFNGRGIASSGGAPRDTIEEMADDIAAFLDAIGVPEVDAVGFSIGGMQVQELARRHPSRVRKTILLGTGSKTFARGTDPRVGELMAQPVIGADDYVFLFFGRSESARRAGLEFWERRHSRADQDPPSSAEVTAKQRPAVGAWRDSADADDPFGYLREIAQPTLVVHGMDDAQIEPISAFELATHLPDAQLILYPDAGHGPHLQFPERFLVHATRFLDE